MGSEFEIASIYADVVLKKIKEKKLMIFKTEPERLEFLYMMFFPLYSKNIGEMSILLSGRFFERSFNFINIKRASLDCKLADLADSHGNIGYSDLEDLRNTFFGDSSDMESADQKDGSLGDFPQESKIIVGAYPNDFHQTLKTEFSLLKNVPQALETSGATLYVTLNQEDYCIECEKVIALLNEIDEDIGFLCEMSSRVSAIIRDNLHYLESEKERLENQHRSKYKQEEEKSKDKLNSLEKDSLQKQRETQSEFKDEIQQIIISDDSAMRYIRDIIVRPITSMEDLADNIGRIRSVMEAPVAKSMSLDTRLKLDDTCGFYEEKIVKMSYIAEEETESIKRHLGGIEKEWQDDIKKMENMIEDVDEIGNEIIGIIDRLSMAKNKEKEEIINNATYEYSYDGTFLVPFYVASLVNGDGKRKFEVYAPSQYDKGFIIINKIQGFSMPLRPISKGLQDLRACIMRNLEQDENLQDEILNAGFSNNMLAKAKYIQRINGGLDQLKKQNILKEKSHLRAKEMLGQHVNYIKNE